MTPPADTTLLNGGSNVATEIPEATASNNKNSSLTHMTNHPSSDFVDPTLADEINKVANTTKAPYSDDDGATTTKNGDKYDDTKEQSNSTGADAQAAEADGTNILADRTRPPAAPHCDKAVDKSTKAAADDGKNSMLAHMLGPLAGDSDPNQSANGNNNVANTTNAPLPEDGSIVFRVENDVDKIKSLMVARTKNTMLQLLMANAVITQESYLVMRKVSVPVNYQRI